MNNLKKAVVVVCLCILALVVYHGCAAIFKGGSDNVDFSSDPDGAKVYVNGVLRGTTPLKLKLESRGVYTIEFKKEGYGTSTYTITNKVGAGWVVLDVLFTGLIGVVVDATTGAWYELDTKYVNAILEKQQ